MQWFKFYGAEFLSDPKVFALSPLERGVFITLLSLASMTGKDSGEIEYLTAERLAAASGTDPTGEYWEAAVATFAKLAHLKIIEVDSNAIVTVVNWRKRQNSYLTNAERQKRFRDKRKSNAEVTLEENRIEYKTGGKPQKKSMKKNKMGSYREDGHQDGYEESIDADTGERAKPKPISSGNKDIDAMIDWAQKRRGKPFLNRAQQIRALKVLWKNKVGGQAIRDTWNEMMQDSYWVKKGFDFWSVTYQLDKKNK